MRLVIISGRSGSGKSTVLRALEDDEFDCIDNFPASILKSLIDKSESQRNLAVCVDVRNSAKDLELLPNVIADTKIRGVQTELVYLDAISATLVKRFSNTRRRHPLADEQTDLRQAIDAEMEVLHEIGELADLRIDTTQLMVKDLVQIARDRIVGKTEQGISLLFRSFGYKHGVPVDADFVFDLRCLPNPFYEEKLRSQTGFDDDVRSYMNQSEEVDEMAHHISTFLHIWLPRFAKLHRIYITIALGCTGGQHRSVYMAERLAKQFRGQYCNLLVRHRDVMRSTV